MTRQGARRASRASLAAARAAAVFLAALLLAAPAAFAQDAPAPGAAVQLTGPQVLALAQDLIARGRTDDAKPLLEALARSRTASVDQTQVAFLQGMVAVADEDYVRARDIFRGILESRPDLVRVRLELARVLFLLEDDRAAAYHFRLALAEAPNADVARTIEQFLAAIERRRTTVFELSVGIAPDSNVNAGTTADTVNLFGFLPSDLSPDARETSGVGLDLAASAAWLPRLGDSWRLELRGSALGTDYGGARYDDIAGLAEAGVRRVFDRGYLALAATYEQRWFGGEEFYSATGGRLTGVARLTPRLQGFAMASGGYYDYVLEDGRDGPVASLSLGASYALSSASLASLRITISREEAELPSRADTSYALQLGYVREFANALTVELTPFAAYRPFDGFDGLFGATRTDWRYGAAVDALNRRWSWKGFSPALGYTYTRNESNIVIYDYRRHQLELKLTREF